MKDKFTIFGRTLFGKALYFSLSMIGVSYVLGQMLGYTVIHDVIIILSCIIMISLLVVIWIVFVRN